MTKKMIEYHSNNSGGDRWLTDEDWINLEKAGWYVCWGDFVYCFCNEKDWKDVCKNKKECEGHRKYNSFEEAKKQEDCYCVAEYAKKPFDSIEESEDEFLKITGQRASEEGCECCGPPHSFEIIDED